MGKCKNIEGNGSNANEEITKPRGTRSLPSRRRMRRRLPMRSQSTLALLQSERAQVTPDQETQQQDTVSSSIAIVSAWGRRYFVRRKVFPSLLNLSIISHLAYDIATAAARTRIAGKHLARFEVIEVSCIMLYVLYVFGMAPFNCIANDESAT